MFGLRIVTERQIDKLVKGVTNDTVRACAQVIKIRKEDKSVHTTDYLRARFEAANEIYQLLQD